MSKIKTFLVSVRVERDFYRTVRAKSESQATRIAKQRILDGNWKLQKKDFNKQYDDARSLND